MTHKELAERVVLPAVIVFALGVLTALHFTDNETDRLRTELAKYEGVQVMPCVPVVAMGEE